MIEEALAISVEIKILLLRAVFLLDNIVAVTFIHQIPAVKLEEVELDFC